MEEYYLDILNNYPHAVAYFNKKGDILFYNKIFNDNYIIETLDKRTISFKEIIEENILKRIIIHQNISSKNFINKIFSEFDSPSEKFIIEFKSGKIFEVFFKISSHENRIMYHNDITDLKRTFEITSVKLSKLELIMETIFSGVISFNNIGEIDYINKSAKLIFSDKQKRTNFNDLNLESLFQGISIEDILDSDKYGIIRELKGKRLSGNIFPIQVIVNKLDSKWSLVDRRKESRDHFIATLNDISESKKLAFELQQSQKMDAIGSLASGIAHDFNNILSIIIGSSSLLRNKDSGYEENIDNITNAAHRAKNLIKQILNYSKPSYSKNEYLDLTNIINEVAQFIKQTTPEKIDINISIEGKDIFIYGDETDIHRCLLNLLTNSVSAIKNSKGEININLKVIKKERIVSLTISDNGIGIKPDIQDRIFDPFFSTKDKSEGTGLGLSMVQRIIKDHNGKISFKSEFKHGTTFEITLPLISKKINNNEGVKNQIELRKSRLKETIIFLDDEELIVKVSSKILANAGYDVQGMTDSTETLNLIQRNSEKYSLLITDQNMPNINGLELTKEIRKNNKNLKIIICSGYTEGIDKSELEQIGIGGVLSKPVSTEKLLEIVNKLLS